MRLTTLVALWLGLSGCTASHQRATPEPVGTFETDVAFLQRHTQVLMLTDASGAQVAVCPAYQGRVMTSTTGSGDRPSFGWIGRAASGARQREADMRVSR